MEGIWSQWASGLTRRQLFGTSPVPILTNMTSLDHLPAFEQILICAIPYFAVEFVHWRIAFLLHSSGEECVAGTAQTGSIDSVIKMLSGDVLSQRFCQSKALEPWSPFSTCSAMPSAFLLSSLLTRNLALAAASLSGGRCILDVTLA
jgi:hypothetical protein